MKTIKHEFENEINAIIDQIKPRINEICQKYKEDLYDEATMFAFWVGIGGDLNTVLSKIEKRNRKKLKLKNGNNKRRK